MRSPLLSTGMREADGDELRPYKLHRCWPCATVTTMLSLALLIVAAAQPTLFRNTFTSALGQVELQLGAFKLCWHAGDVDGCRDIDGSYQVQPLEQLPDLKGQRETPQRSSRHRQPAPFCSAQPTAAPLPPPCPLVLTGSVVSDCDEFNAARGLLLAAVFFLALGLLFQLCAAMRSWVKGTTVFAFALTLLGSLCGLVSMALYATLRDQGEGLVMAGASFGLSFVVLSVGWPLALLSSLVYCPFTD